MGIVHEEEIREREPALVEHPLHHGRHVEDLEAPARRALAEHAQTAGEARLRRNGRHHEATLAIAGDPLERVERALEIWSAPAPTGRVDPEIRRTRLHELDVMQAARPLDREREQAHEIHVIEPEALQMAREVRIDARPQLVPLSFALVGQHPAAMTLALEATVEHVGKIVPKECQHDDVG